MEEAMQALKAIFLVGGLGFFAIFLLGMTNRVVIFQDVVDFWWSIALILLPVATVLIAFFMAPADAPPSYNVFWADGYGKVITIVGSGATLFAMLKVFSYSVAANGMGLGVVVFLFKVIASVVLLFLVLGMWSKDEKNSAGLGGILAFITVGLLWWILKKLINGPAVEARRAALQGEVS